MKWEKICAKLNDSIRKTAKHKIQLIVHNSRVYTDRTQATLCCYFNATAITSHNQWVLMWNRSLMCRNDIHKEKHSFLWVKCQKHTVVAGSHVDIVITIFFTSSYTAHSSREEPPSNERKCEMAIFGFCVRNKQRANWKKPKKSLPRVRLHPHENGCTMRIRV